MTRASLSVVLFVKNEAERLAGALATVRWADEIVVIDDASTDGTPELAEQLGARVIRCEDSGGHFYRRRSFGFSQATSDWVLLMDPDERMSPELQAAIVSMLEQPTESVGFKFARANYLEGRPLRHGGWQEAVLHLFRRSHIPRWDHTLHMRQALVGPVGTLPGVMEHYPFEPLSALLQKQNLYSTLEAAELAEQFKDRPISWLGRQIIRQGWKRFWKTAVGRAGLLDGRRGLTLAVLFAWVQMLKWAKCYELRVSAAPAPDVAAAAGRSKWSLSPTRVEETRTRA